jgi:hypothetical protein
MAKYNKNTKNAENKKRIFSNYKGFGEMIAPHAKREGVSQTEILRYLKKASGNKHIYPKQQTLSDMWTGQIKSMPFDVLMNILEFLNLEIKIVKKRR